MVKLAGTLVLVGAGKMGGAMLEGWLKGGADPSRIVALDPSPPAEVKELLARHGVRLIFSNRHLNRHLYLHAF